MSEHVHTGSLLASAADGHRWQVIRCAPLQPTAALLWLPALGVAARHYHPFAQALASTGIAVYLHEWRGNGSSTLRPSRQHDWGYRTLLADDLPASHVLLDRHDPQLPRVLGGHSLGGQLACCHAALQSAQLAQLWLVASGSPYWRNFPAPMRYGLPVAFRLLPWLARMQGVLHGRQLGFGGTEARSLIADWAQVGRSNRYRAAGAPWDLEQALGALRVPIRAVTLARDNFGPAAALRALLDKMPRARANSVTLDAMQLGTRSDHFAWMKTPAAVAAALRSALDDAVNGDRSSQRD
ncbi:alpha/beta hydrolase family protein [Xanthomonas nasturtii]|uniref:alpha/beta hydrolase family protein n=1 Tax=Xanthomonas nasturtii TaxID=1843581 RepID=UPI0020135984|nr:alpha/beta fold hydrolase [Xanthomonas nasturtii]MCL1498939.1 alpha/beta fold hydrolase [Xanthomonas nasturtii]MCL1525227.1 alpha/beta fold hydrolase [Xanthomonas nasturtii]MCL1535218.1 alpha/beta fold hydrolase [Xanthomonas nasturtii]MCL1542195.1 alpha/beta fold hydrolase [Xanthomonas nasturtii]